MHVFIIPSPLLGKVSSNGSEEEAGVFCDSDATTARGDGGARCMLGMSSRLPSSADFGGEAVG